MKWGIETRYRWWLNAKLGTAGRDSVFVCGKDGDRGGDTMTHYNLVSGEKRYTVRLDEAPTGMATVLCDKQTCIALSNG